MLNANGCTKSVTQSIINLSGPVITNVTKSNVTCNGGNNGSITIQFSNGTAPFQYQWSNGITVQSLSNIVAGSYTLTIKDANNCTAAVSESVLEPLKLVANTTSSPASCGQFNGSVGV